MNPDFIATFNYYKIYHISADEYTRLSTEADRLGMRPSCFDRYLEVSLHRRFVIYKDTHFMYCKEAFYPVLCMMPSHLDYFCPKKPTDPVLSYIFNTYQRMLAMETCRQYGRDNTEYIIANIVVPKYYTELFPPIVDAPPAPTLSLPPIASASKKSKESGDDNIPAPVSPTARARTPAAIPKPPAAKKRSIPLALKRKVWNSHIGESVGKTRCLCCKLTDITQLNFSCGHSIAESNGGALTLENLKPICVSCNSSMGTRNMDDFIREYGL